MGYIISLQGEFKGNFYGYKFGVSLLPGQDILYLHLLPSVIWTVRVCRNLNHWHWMEEWLLLLLILLMWENNHRDIQPGWEVGGVLTHPLAPQNTFRTQNTHNFEFSLQSVCEPELLLWSSCRCVWGDLGLLHLSFDLQEGGLWQHRGNLHRWRTGHAGPGVRPHRHVSIGSIVLHQGKVGKFHLSLGNIYKNIKSLQEADWRETGREGLTGEGIDPRKWDTNPDLYIAGTHSLVGGQWRGVSEKLPIFSTAARNRTQALGCKVSVGLSGKCNTGGYR